jgi:polar amino acid transport system substrate-binding protein
MERLLMKKTLAMLFTLLVAVTLFAGCSQSAPTGGTLIVGLDDTFAPMGFRDEAGELVGFDIDLAMAVGEEMGYEIKFQPISWDAK